MDDKGSDSLSEDGVIEEARHLSESDRDSAKEMPWSGVVPSAFKREEAKDERALPGPHRRVMPLRNSKEAKD